MREVRDRMEAKVSSELSNRWVIRRLILVLNQERSFLKFSQMGNLDLKQIQANWKCTECFRPLLQLFLVQT